jgi:HPt (histidine-containing phosphotransfer) domain-containing protein
MKKVTYGLSQMIQMFDNDPVFIEERSTDLDRVTLAIREEDRDNLPRYAHKIKPSLEMFGHQGYWNALVLENWGKGDEIKDANKDFMFLDKELQKTLIQLKRDF